MGEILQEYLKMKNDLPVRETMDLNLKVASFLVFNCFEKLVSEYGITTTQYNVLRILKGSHPSGLARCDIASRMIERASDITRIIDRLEKQGLAVRDRTHEDRRISLSKITEKGLKIVKDLKPIIEKEHKKITKNLTEEECSILSELLEKLYSDKF